MLNEKPNTDSSFTGSSDDDQIGQLLSGLKRVEAPGDFEFRVRAGIAERNSSAGTFSWLTGPVKVAAPAGLLLILGGYLGIGSLYPPMPNDGQVVAENQFAGVAPMFSAPVLPERPAVPASQSAAVQEPANNILANNLPFREIGNRSGTVPEKRPTTARAEETGGSYDVGLGESKNRIDLSDRNPNANSAALNVSSVLTMMGISAAYAGSGWRVGSVTGMAQRSGLRPGDVIEAVNGRAVTANTSFGNSFRGTSLTVRRDGKLVQIAVH